MRTPVAVATLCALALVGQPARAQAPQVTPLSPNRTSVFGADALGAGQRGEAVLLGFPLVSARALLGVTERVDLGLGFDTSYGELNEVRVVGRLGAVGQQGWRVGAALEVGWAFFAQRAAVEVNGARWLTGRRDLNVSPTVLATYQQGGPRAPRLVTAAAWVLALDLQPVAAAPLSGTPPKVQVGHNAELRLGAELPLSARASFVFLLHLGVHGRTEDVRVMPGASVGVVLGL